MRPKLLVGAFGCRSGRGEHRANHHDGGQSPPMMKGACGCLWGRVPVRETSSERSLLVGGYTPTANRTDLVSPYPKLSRKRSLQHAR